MQLVIDTEKQTQQPLAEYISKQALENTELHKQIGVYREFVQNLCHDLGLSLQSDLVSIKGAIQRGFLHNPNRRKLLDIYSELNVAHVYGTLGDRLDQSLEAIKKLKKKATPLTDSFPAMRALARVLDIPVADNDSPAQTLREIHTAVNKLRAVSESRRQTIEKIGESNRELRKRAQGVSLERHAEVGQERALLRSQLEQEKLRSAAVERKLADAILLGDRLAQELRDEKVKAVNTCPPGFKVVSKDTLDYARHQPGDSHFKVVPV